MKGQKILALLLGVTILVSFVACGNKKTTSDPASSEEPSSEVVSETQTSDNLTEEDSSELPLTNEPITLRYFHYLDGKVSASMASHNEIRCYQELEEKTGVNIEWLHPPVGQESEQFNLLIASNELPDLIHWTNWNGVPGGVYGMLENEAILPLNDLIDAYAPNYKSIVTETDDILRQTQLDDGTQYAFMTLFSEGHRANAGGLQIRQDWLDNLGLSVPNTMDELEEVLVAFKENDSNGNGEADEIPFVAVGSGGVLPLARAYGVSSSMCLDGDTIQFGPITPGYEKYLLRMKDWYDKGLLDKEYVVTDNTSLQAKVTGDLGGVYWGILGANLGTYMQAKADDPDFKLNGVPYLQDDNGVRNAFLLNHTNGAGTAITTACEYPEIATRWLDYAYSDEGHMLMVFGVEGENYDIVDGEPIFRDIIMNNPDGLAFSEALARYSVGSMSGAYEKDHRQFEQAISAVPEQIQCLHRWQEGNPVNDIFLPPLNLTSEESNRYSEIMTEINTYVDEMHDKFVMGKESLDNYETYIANIYQLGLEEAIELQQEAYNRYIA